MLITKTKFSTDYSKLLAKSICNKPVTKEVAEWIKPYLYKSKYYSTKINRNGCLIVPVFRKYGFKKQKFFSIVEPNGEELIIFKSKLINSLWKSKSKSAKIKVLSVMRSTISDQISQYRKEVKETIKSLIKAGFLDKAKDLNRCKITGRNLNTCKTCVDHYDKCFLELAENWLESKGLNYETIAVRGKTFKENDFTLSWQEYHRANSKLQMVCSSANSSVGSRGYRSKM